MAKAKHGYEKQQEKEKYEGTAKAREVYKTRGERDNTLITLTDFSDKNAVKKFVRLIRDEGKYKEAREFYRNMNPATQRTVQKKAGLWLRILTFKNI